jgi:hypothetical protein
MSPAATPPPYSHPEGFVPGEQGVVTRPARAEATPERPIPTQTMSDLGSLMLAFIMVWAYLSFCQFLLIWSGNLPVEVKYYTFPSNRVEGVWGNVALALAVLHFALPFFLLLNTGIKRNRKYLAAVALWVLAMRVVEMIWTIVPAFSHGSEGHGFSFAGALLYPAALAGVGGLWLAFYLWQLRRLPLLPRYNPEESAHGPIAHH